MRTSALAVVTAAVAFAACGNDQATQDATQALSQLTKAATQMAEQAQKVAGGATGVAPGGKDAKPVPPVSYKQLIGYCPRSSAG